LSADAGQYEADQGEGPVADAGTPSEEDRTEIGQRAAYEAELSRITIPDMMAQAVVSLLNIGARRLGPPPGAQSAEGGAEAGAGTAGHERDLEQVRDAIDGVRALLGILERRLPKELGPLRDALSQLQMAYAREVQKGEPDTQGVRAPAGQQGQAQPAEQKSSPAGSKPPDGPGPAEASGRLWVPGR
jgi:hypothetical protein